jgi:diguanylate cyclase (GGDEF)-like protein/PAS domain S-box-containing protein
VETYVENNHLKENSKKVLEYINTCQQFSWDNTDYRFFTNSVKELSGAALVGLNLVSEKDTSKTTVKAVSGAPELLSKLLNSFGFNLEDTEWEAKYEEIKIVEKNKLIYFSSFREIGYYDSFPRLEPVLKMIEKLLLPGGLYTMEFDYQGEFLGIMTLIMSKNKTIEDKDLIELYINHISGTIKRIRAENKLQQKVNDLRESEAKFKAYMEESPLGIFVANNEGRYIGVNRAACRMSGYTEMELLNLTVSDLLAPQFMEKNMELFHKVIEKGSAEVDVMLRKKSGETFWVNLAAAIIDDNKAIAFCQDITERKESEERAKELTCLRSFSLLLQKEKNNLEKILEETVKLLPPSFQYPEDVGACIKFRGLEFKTSNYIHTPWKISAHLELYGTQTGIIEVCYLKPPLHERESFSKDEKLMLGTIAEHLSRITEQIQAEEDLQKSKNQLSTTLQSIGDGVIVTDANGKITRLNPQAEKLTGWTTEEALGRALHEVFHIVNIRTGEPVANPVYRVIETGKTQDLANDTILIARDGRKYHIADSAAPILDDENKMYGVIMVFSDVTKRKNAEESIKYQLRFEKLIADISNTFASQPSEHFDQSINHALELVGEFFQVDRSYVFQFSDDGKQMNNTYEWCANKSEMQKDQLQDIQIYMFPWWRQKIINKKIVYIPDVDSLPPEAEAEKIEFKSQSIQSLLSIPMTKNGTVFGFLGLDAVREKKTWTENQIMLLTVVADLILNAYTRNLAEEKVRYQSFHDGLTGLYNRVYLEKEIERLDTERQLPIGIIMADLNGLKLINDTFGHEVGDEMLRQSAEILKKSCRREDIIARWGGDEFVIFLPQTTKEDSKAILQRIVEKCTETYVKDISLSLSVGSAIKNNSNENMVDILKEAEENMYRHKLEESKQIKGNVLNVMLKKLKTKSFETEFHYSNMLSIAHRIGKKIGLAQTELNKLDILISYHDIGEITISEDILTKKDPLTEEEWEIIKKHPETGFRIARATESIALVAEDILSHHERWDGSGYPQGLKEKEIPLLARITAIADAYEVMSSGRPYKKAMSKSDVIAELKRCAGLQFDPELIETFLLLLDAEKME